MSKGTYCTGCKRTVDWTKDWLKDPDGTWHWHCAPKHSKSFYYDQKQTSTKKKGGGNGRRGRR